MKTYDIIQYEGPNDIFVWKHPCEDFYTNTQLVVHESQEALFFMNGQALDLFGPGRHTLETQNLPLLTRIKGALFGTDGKKPFHCEVYFINKAVAMDMVWGTNSPIQYQDPGLHDILLPIRANGQYAVQVKDGRKLLVKLVGTTSLLARDELTRYFRGEFMMQIKTALSQMMYQNRISFIWINSYLTAIAAIVQAQLEPVFNEYGLSLKRFQLSSVTVPEDDPSYDAVKAALAEAARRKIQGYTYQDEQRFAIAHKLVSNDGAGSLAGAAMGAALGVGAGLPFGAGVGEMLGGVMREARAQPAEGASFCSQCGKPLKADDNFCSKCGAKANRGDA